MSEAFIGEIRLFGGNYAPVNWHKCDGTMLAVNDYQAMFALIGTLYGGDGVNTFGLPDLRGRVPVGVGQGPGLTARTIGGKFGAETVSLVSTELPSHNHTLAANKAAASSEFPSNALFAAQTDGDKIYLAEASTNQLATLAATSVSTAGNSLPHANVMPSLAVTYIICLNGLFPSRN
ncbi:phage tail protein [Shewanella sp. SM23]|uniref:phage tail protein n=1 Tax=Shewanella sp. SM23 TaxID=2912794 RepID=UPI0021D899A6|nr:tail fiber protein [Shewanella sp. SM23]MCU8084473.1 tail fiber protein [Shewanella sp. SM23]